MKKKTIQAVLLMLMLSGLTDSATSTPLVETKEYASISVVFEDATEEAMLPVVAIEPHITYETNEVETVTTQEESKEDDKERTKAKASKKKNGSKKKKKEKKASSETEYDNLELLARCVQAEAGNQDLYGKQLVVSVILNRVDSDKFPNTVEGVITQKGQFSVWSNGSINNVTPDEDTEKAIELELENRSDSTIIFFTAGRYSSSGSPAYKYGDHYFSTLSK